MDFNFKGFYDEIIFDVDRSILKSYTGKQGDTKSRGLYVTVTQKNAVIEDLTGLSMRFFYEKPDKTRGFIDGVVDGSKFRIDYTNQVYAVPGVVKAELRLMGADEEIITAKTFKILVDSSIADGSIISENERGILDRAFELAEDIIPRLELLDVELLEDVQDEMLGARYSGTKDVTYDSLGQRLNAAEQDLLNHKAEYTSNRQLDQLKVAKVEKELNDYKATMQQVNINQEPKQKATGYGVISLPPNAAEGQISGVELKGLTATNLIKNGDFSNGTENWLFYGAYSDYVLINDYIEFTPTVYSGIGQLYNSISDHKYYFRFTAKADSDLTLTYGFGTSGIGASFNSVAITTTDTMVSGIVIPDNQYEMIVFGRPNPANIKIYIKKYVLVIDLTATFGAGNEPTVEECDKIFTNYFEGTKSTISAFRIRSVSEDESQESNAYVIVTDKDTGEILELRSLPNGTKDEINVAERRVIKRTKKIIFDGSENWEEFMTAYADTDGFYRMKINGWVTQNKAVSVRDTGLAWNDLATFRIVPSIAAGGLPNSIGFHPNGNLYLSLPRDYIDANYSPSIEGMRQYLADHPITLIYQLAEPIEIPVQVSGSIVSYPNGTIYIERILPDAGVYTDKISVLHQDAPIKRLDRLSKVDFYTGVETELDVSEAVVAEDKLSFTHPDLSEGDIVFFEYEYDVESTEGETEVEYYDSRYVVKDDVTGKFYKWNVKVSNGTPTIEVVEV